MDVGDDSFDIIIYSHVLKHLDKERALGELRRFLKLGGTLAIMIPICEGLNETYENHVAAEGTDHDRWLHFQQSDYNRIISRDFRQLANESGFSVEEFTAKGPSAVKHGLNMGDKVFLLR